MDKKVEDILNKLLDKVDKMERKIYSVDVDSASSEEAVNIINKIETQIHDKKFDDDNVNNIDDTIDKLNGSPERKIYSVDVGSVSSKEAVSIINNIKSEIHDKNVNNINDLVNKLNNTDDNIRASAYQVYKDYIQTSDVKQLKHFRSLIDETDLDDAIIVENNKEKINYHFLEKLIEAIDDCFNNKNNLNKTIADLIIKTTDQHELSLFKSEHKFISKLCFTIIENYNSKILDILNNLLKADINDETLLGPDDPIPDVIELTQRMEKYMTNNPYAGNLSMPIREDVIAGI